VTRRSEALDLSGIDFDQFVREPLDEPTLRCIRYMHDVEHHTVCYLRDLLVTPLHKDPAVTTFLAIWAYEEHWHGEALGQVLKAHGEPANNERVESLRGSLGALDRMRPLISQLTTSIIPGSTAVPLAWGAVNEWTTQAGYARLAELARNPTLTELLRRIMRQEGRHIDFYSHEAALRLSQHRLARRTARFMLHRFWAPVGSGVMPAREVNFLTRHLFGGEAGRISLARIDRQIDRLPGLAGLHLASRAMRGRGVA
jgi:rubrerythrin